jgi:misacylated tRNA(Ala) deacylase
MSEPLFRTDPYRRETATEVVRIDNGGVVCRATVFYPQGGGQPGDSGILRRADGSTLAISAARYHEDRQAIVHCLDPAADIGAIEPGETVVLSLDWPRRHLHMRIHTALHLLSVVLPYPVTGGAVGAGEGRLDFDLKEAGLDRATIAAELNRMIAADRVVREQWIDAEALRANPGLVKTLSVKPPTGEGKVRLIEIDGLDVQPCGGTHVARTGEIGLLAVTAIEKKGKQNRRVRIALV